MISKDSIVIDHSDNQSGMRDIVGVYDVDSGPLAMPEHIRIGQQDHAGKKIGNYADQVDDYAVWLEDQIKNQNQQVMEALDHIFNKALGGAVVLTTTCCPAPWITHAHAVRRQILELAGVKFDL